MGVLTRLRRLAARFGKGADRRAALIVFVLFAAVAVGGLWQTSRATDTAQATIKNNRVLIRSGAKRALRLSDRITQLLAKADALAAEVDASHDDLAVLRLLVEQLGGTVPPPVPRTIVAP